MSKRKHRDEDDVPEGFSSSPASPLIPSSASSDSPLDVSVELDFDETSPVKLETSVFELSQESQLSQEPTKLETTVFELSQESQLSQEDPYQKENTQDSKYFHDSFHFSNISNVNLENSVEDSVENMISSANINASVEGCSQDFFGSATLLNLFEYVKQSNQDIESDYFGSDDDEEFEELGPSNTPLYEDAPLTVGDSLLAILAFTVRHNLTKEAKKDLLKLIDIHCRKKNKQTIPSLHLFQKHFSHLNVKVKFHYFCSVCYCSLLTEKTVCPQKAKHPKSSISYFLEIPLIPQIQALFKRKGFHENLCHQFTREKTDPSNIEDIYDGQIYKELVENGFLDGSNRFNFALLWNTDGVPVFHSTAASMWPFYFILPGLPFDMRYKKENTLLGGIWFGAKPQANVMVEPFIESMKTMKKGFEVLPYGFDSPVVARGIVICGTCDRPAQAQFLSLKCSGSYACHICKIEGESVKIVKNVKSKQSVQSKKGGKKTLNEGTNEQVEVKTSSVWVYPYSENLELRQHTETVVLGVQALEARKKAPRSQRDSCHVLGVKGPSVVSKIMPDVIRGMGIDDLHTVYHGVCQKLLSLFLLANQPYSIRKFLPLLQEQMSQIHLPNYCQKSVPDLAIVEQWKASDYKIFFLYLVLVLLEGVLPDVYFANLCDFVYIIYTANSESISPSDIEKITSVSSRFVKEFERLYGKRHMTIKVHNILHFGFVINNLGPSRSYSCFPFESLNGQMLRMIHGTRYVQVQLANCAYTVLNLPHELKSIRSPEVKKFCSDISKTRNVRVLEQIGESSSVGRYSDFPVVPVELKSLLSEMYELESISCKTFPKLKKGTLLFVSMAYKRSVNNLSYVVSYRTNNGLRYGAIEYFVKIFSSSKVCVNHTKCDCKFFAVMNVLNLKPFSNSPHAKVINHIHCIEVSNCITLVSPDKLIDIHVCFPIEGKGLFMAQRCNQLEVE